MRKISIMLLMIPLVLSVMSGCEVYGNENNIPQKEDNGVTESDKVAPYSFSKVKCDWGIVVAVTTDGKVIAWGDSALGGLGNGRISSYYNESGEVDLIIEKPNILQFDERIVDANGALNAYAITENGNVYLWGSNSQGELGIESGNVLSPVKMDFDKPIKQVELSNNVGFSLFLTTDGEVWYSGADVSKFESLNHFYYGINAEEAENYDVGYKKFSLPFACTKISASPLGYSLLSDKGEVYFRGFMDGKNYANSVDIDLPGLTKIEFPEIAVDITCGVSSVVAVSETGNVYVYGTKGLFYDDESDTDLGDRLYKKNLANIIDVSSAEWYYTALDKFGNVYMWGVDKYGLIYPEKTLADDAPFEIITAPVRVFEDIAYCSVGGFNVALITNDGKTIIRGNDAYKQVSWLKQE